MVYGIGDAFLSWFGHHFLYGLDLGTLSKCSSIQKRLRPYKKGPNGPKTVCDDKKPPFIFFRAFWIGFKFLVERLIYRG